jgi:membrane-bound lytic murein transglycosylase D
MTRMFKGMDTRRPLKSKLQKALRLKSIGLFVVAFFTINAAFARTGETDVKVVKKDSATADAAPDYAFKDLFNNGQFNPAEAYVTQLNPLAVPFVEDYIRRQGKELEAMKGWAQPYFRMMDGILMSYGIPKEMKYLAVIESHLKPALVSWAGAVGPWQFMPETGRRMGLAVNGYYDERTNYYKSTHAAAKYMKELYSQLGDWMLVVAAYNCGPGRVFSAIRKTGSHNFWELQYSLPLESRNHVKKFIGTHYIMEGSGGLTTSTTEEWNTLQLKRQNQATQLQSSLSVEEVAGTKELNIVGKYNSLIMAKNLSMDIVEFNKLNPGFDALVDNKDGYNLRLPEFKMQLFNANRYIILHECVLTALQSPVGITGFPSESRLKNASSKRKK